MEKSCQIIKVIVFCLTLINTDILKAQLINTWDSRFSVQLSATLNVNNRDNVFQFSHPLKSGFQLQLESKTKNQNSFYLSCTNVNQMRKVEPLSSGELISINTYTLSAGFKCWKFTKNNLRINFYAGLETKLGNERYSWILNPIWNDPIYNVMRTCSDVGISITPNLQYKISSNLILNVFIRQSVFIYFNKNHFPTNIFPSRMNTSIGLGLSYSLF
jgi:hypothetical protein